MKLLFSSSDPADVNHMNTRLVAAGIPCEVRRTSLIPEPGLAGSYSELWVRNHEDFRTAVIIFATAGSCQASRLTLR